MTCHTNFNLICPGESNYFLSGGYCTWTLYCLLMHSQRAKWKREEMKESSFVRGRLCDEGGSSSEWQREVQWIIVRMGFQTQSPLRMWASAALGRRIANSSFLLSLFEFYWLCSRPAPAHIFTPRSVYTNDDAVYVCVCV